MNAYLYTVNKELSDFLIPELFRLGLCVYRESDPSGVYNTIFKNGLDCYLFDLDSKNVNWLELIRFIKKDSKTNKIPIVIFTKSQKKEFVTKVVLEGVNLIFDLNQPLSLYCKRLASIIQFLDKESKNKRKYVRIQPVEKDHVTVNLVLEGRNMAFQGSVRDLSAVAAALQLDDENGYRYFKKDDKIINFQINIAKKTYYSEAKVLRSAENVLVIQFTNTNKAFNHGVTHFIFQKIWV